MKRIEVKGHSGCTVCIEKGTDDFSSDLIISKSTHDPKYVPRLKAQIEKQKAIQNNLDNLLYSCDIKIPSIINTTETESLYVASMEYMYGTNFISFFENSTKKEIDDFINKICEYIDFEISCSTQSTSNEKVMYKKWLSVKNNLEKLFIDNEEVESYISKEVFKIIEVCDNIFTEDMKLDGIPVKENVCHGDLTFSNIIFTNDGTYGLIDFLDSFIETPLMDIVKLRQDSCYDWSTLMYEKNDYDKVRYDIIRKYIDKKIDEHFSSYSFYTEYYDIFQLMNFLRVLQYAKEKHITEYLISVITSIINNYSEKIQ